MLYNSFLFTKTQRNYGTHKRELCAIIEFYRKHKYFFEAPQRSIIFTDYTPLTWFLTRTSHEGIYAWWVIELRLLNVETQYITGKRNAAVDGLSRTIFPSQHCDDDYLDHFSAVNPDTRLWIRLGEEGVYLRGDAPCAARSLYEGRIMQR